MSTPVLMQLLAEGRVRWRDGALLRNGTLAEAARAVRGRPVTLLVPGETVLLTRANIPSRSSAEIARALPYALEDVLLQPPEIQHYTWTRDAGVIVAAVAAQHILRQWLDACADAGIEPDAVLSDVLALPWQAGEWTLLLEGDRALLRSGRYEGFACARRLAPAWLAAALARCAADARPAALRVLRVDGELPALPEGIALREESAVPGAWMQAPPSGLNLRGGPFAAHRSGGAAPWRALAAALLLAVLSGLALMLTRDVVLRREQRMLQTGVDALFHRALPAQKRIVDARAQLAEALLQAQRAGGGPDGLALLAQAALPLTATPGARLTRVVWRDGTLQMGLRLPAPADYDALRRRLQAQGLRVELTAASAPGAVAWLRLRNGAAP